MPAYLVVVRPRDAESVSNHSLAAGTRELQLQVDGIAEEQRYLLSGQIASDRLEQLVAELLVDPVLNSAILQSLDAPPVAAFTSTADWALDIAYRAGVTDNEGESVRIGAVRAGVS